MTTKEIKRVISTLDDAMTSNLLVLVGLGISFVCLMLGMFGVSTAADGASAFSLLAALFAALNHKTLSNSRDGWWREGKG